MRNQRNQFGFKDQSDCYRNSAGRHMIQWMDEGSHGKEAFDTELAEIRALGKKYRVTRLDDGRRLFIEH